MIKEKTPKYLEEVIESRYSEGMLRQIIIRTPSGQFWNNLSQLQQNKWREEVESLGADPEDYLQHMREMQPVSPKGVE